MSSRVSRSAGGPGERYFESGIAAFTTAPVALAPVVTTVAPTLTAVLATDTTAPAADIAPQPLHSAIATAAMAMEICLTRWCMEALRLVRVRLSGIRVELDTLSLPTADKRVQIKLINTHPL